MVDDPYLTFSSNLMNRFIQAQQIKLQRDIADRQERRFEDQMRLNQQREGRTARYQQGMLGLSMGREQRQGAYQDEMTRQGRERLDLSRKATEGAALSPSRQIGSYMSGLQPGSPEWMQAGKLTSGSTNITVDTGVTQSTRAKLEDQINQLDKTMTEVEALDQLMKPEYMNVWGKARAYGEKTLEQAGAKKGSQWMSDYATWDSLAMSVLLEKKHEITGVAANAAEMVQIGRAVPDPDRDTYTSMKAKLAIMKDLMGQHRARLNKYAQQGIFNPTSEQLTAMPLKLTSKQQEILEKSDSGEDIDLSELKMTPDDITLEDLDKMTPEELDALEQEMFGNEPAFPEKVKYQDAFGWRQ